MNGQVNFVPVSRFFMKMGCSCAETWSLLVQAVTSLVD